MKKIRAQTKQKQKTEMKKMNNNHLYHLLYPLCI